MMLRKLFANVLELLKRGNWKLPLLALIGLGFALTTVMARSEPESKQPLLEPPQSSFVKHIAGIGVVEPKSEIISIGVELPGVVRQISIKAGDNVKKGDVLFVLDEREVDAQINTLEKSLASMTIQAKDAAEQFAIVRNIADKRAVAKDEFNRRQYAKQLYAAKVAEIQSQLDQAKTTKDRLTVRAPIDGRILELNAHLGEYAGAGALTKPLILMGDVSTLYVRVEIDEENAPLVKEGDQAVGYQRGDTDNKIPLEFVRFEPYVHPKQNLAIAGQRVDTRVLQILYVLPENIDNVFVGQQMDVFINNEQTDNASANSDVPKESHANP